MTSSLEFRGKTVIQGRWDSLTITLWGPARTEPEILRQSAMFPASHKHLDDRSLQAVIDGAKKALGGRRLRDGRYHV